MASIGSFDQDGDRAGGWWGGGSVELGAFAVEEGVGGVEVLRPGVIVVGEVGVAAGDEPEDLAVVDDRQDEPVAEPVDDRAGPGPGDEAGEFHFLVGDAVAGGGGG